MTRRCPIPNRFVLDAIGLGLCAIAAMGCPRDVGEPDPPSSAACVTAVDCTPDGSVCGRVYACVAGYCEIMPSRTEPCP